MCVCLFVCLFICVFQELISGKLTWESSPQASSTLSSGLWTRSTFTLAVPTWTGGPLHRYTHTHTHTNTHTHTHKHRHTHRSVRIKCHQSNLVHKHIVYPFWISEMVYLNLFLCTVSVFYTVIMWESGLEIKYCLICRSDQWSQTISAKLNERLSGTRCKQN